jgi:hypothetical protein
MNALFFSLVFSLFSTFACCELYLKDRLVQGNPGDYLVIAQGKNTIFFQILEKTTFRITVEEITTPNTFLSGKNKDWEGWRTQGAPQHTSWFHYPIGLPEGRMESFFNVDKRKWVKPGEQDSFLNTLLNLPFYPLSRDYRRKIGHKIPAGMEDTRPLWEPPLVFEGNTIQGVHFNAYYTAWPEDGSFLSGKTIEIYLPDEASGYPVYFPYWLQIKGVIGQAKVRVIDSGRLTLPK